MDFRYQLRYQLTKILRCSHKQAEAFCRAGEVEINMKVETNPRQTLGYQEQIRLKSEIIREGIDLKYVLFYKPNQYECTTNREIKNNIFEVLPARFHDLFPLGRLDINSEGLLLLTNDGQLYRQMMGHQSEVEKEYLVHTYQPVTEFLRKSFTEPFLLGKRNTRPAVFEQIDQFSFKVILKEGINRHIRRICAKNENQVKQLTRIRFGEYTLSDLKSGEWKELTERPLIGLGH